MGEVIESKEAKMPLSDMLTEETRRSRRLASQLQEATDTARAHLEELVTQQNEALAAIIDKDIDIVDPDQVFVLTQAQEYRRKLPGYHSAIGVRGNFKGLSVFDTSILQTGIFLDRNPDPRDEVPRIRRLEICAVVEPSEESWYKDEKLIFVPLSSRGGHIY